MTRAAMKSLPDFVVVGAQRSASTHLTACLADHPEIFMCRDEVPYFESPFFDTTPPLALAQVFAAARPGQRLGIQRPEYLGRPECPANIRSVVPDARILAVLRDPVARAVSAYFWYVQFGLLPVRRVDEAFERLLDRQPDPAHPRAGDILDFGFYGRHLSRYVELFGRDRVLVVLGEDLADPATFSRVYRFLGVDPDHRPGVSQRRTNAGVYDLRRLRVLRARRRFAWSWDSVSEYRYRPRRLRRPLSSLVAAAVVGFDRMVLSRAFAGSPPALRPDLERQLRALYADDLDLLESLLERDLKGWRGDHQAEVQPPTTR